MLLTTQELETLRANSLSLENARALGKQIESDPTVKGIFPKAANGDFSDPDLEKFKKNWCPWWSLAVILLKLAKVFTNDKVDKVIDELVELGTTVCE